MTDKNHSESRPVVALKGVTKRYTGQLILDQLDFVVQDGEKVVLMGASGCGKSTLLRCIDALEPVDSGQIRVLGEDLSAPTFDANRFRSRIGMVFQQFNLFPHLSVLENITLAPTKVLGVSQDEAIEQGLSLLERVGLPEKAHSYPDRLSGGQQQRVAIARSLAMQPELMLLDEPTSALDPPMTREVLSVIEDVALQDGVTLLIITHEVNFAEQVADRIVFLHEGRVVEEGSPGRILYHPRHETTKAYLEALHYRSEKSQPRRA